MKSFFLLIAIVTSVFASLRKAPEPQSARKLDKLPGNVHTMNAVGTFPTNPKYFAYEVYQGGASCSTLVYSDSILLDTCLANSFGSVKYVCDSATGEVTYTDYSDTTCTTVGTTFQITTSCGSSTNFRKLLSCSTTTPTASFANYGNNWVLYDQYQSSGCSSQFLGATGYQNGVCFSTGATDSFKYQWPNVLDYTSSDSCGGTPSSTSALPQTCQAPSTTDDDYVAYNSYTTFTYLEYTPSAAPTAAPSNPSAAPTIAPSAGPKSDSDSDSLSQGALIGIIVGSVVGFILLVGIIAYLAMYGCGGTAAAQGPVYSGVEVTKK